MSGTPTERYVRSPDLVWRLAHDRVLVRRVGDHDAAAATDLLGAAALVWVAAEYPLTATEIAIDTALDADAVAASISLLVAGRWMESS